MIQIRKNTFETNSSSTHCLVINNEADFGEDAFNAKYDVFAGKSEPIYVNGKEIPDGECFISVQDKLSYLARLICMQLRSEEDDWDSELPANKLLALLKELFPNTDFSAVNHERYEYYYEDGDWVLEESAFDDKLEFEPFLDINVLKDLFLRGIIYFGSRDTKGYADFVDAVYEKSKTPKASISG